MPPGELSVISRNYEILALATVWALSACAVGPVLGAYAVLVADIVDSPIVWVALPAHFEIPYTVFLSAVAINAASFVPLTAVLFLYGKIASTRPSIERSWPGLVVSTLLLAALCAFGVLVPARIFRADSWVLPLIVFPVAFVALLMSRWLVRGLEPHAFLRSSVSIQAVKSTAGAALKLLLLITVLTVATVLVESELILPCLGPEDSCFEVVLSRGLPYPFIQRSFIPSVFVYDVCSIGLLILLGLRFLRTRRIAA